MVLATVQPSISQKDRIVAHFASAVYSENTEQLRAACKELADNYDQDEIQKIWKEISPDFSTPQRTWIWRVFQSIKGESAVTVMMPAKPLTSQEQKQLKKLESQVEEGVRSYIKTGEALKEIHDNKLYREYGTFEEYVQDRWDFEGRTAYRYIKSAELAEQMRPIGHILPPNESVARELSKVKDPQKRIEVWQELTATNPEPKAREVRAVVEKLNSKPQPASIQEEEKVQVIFPVGKLVTINCKSGAESTFDGYWGRIVHIANNGRYRVSTAKTAAVFDPHEVEECELVSEAIAARIEALVSQESNGHVADLAATFYKHERYEPWQIDLLGFLEGKV